MKLTFEDTEIIRNFEGLSLTSYQCQAGKWTISYGICGPEVVEGLCITEEESKEMFMNLISKYCEKLDRCLPSNITKNKYIACLSLAWNIGMPAFQASTLLKCLKLGDWGGAAEQFLVWDKVTVNGKKIMNRGLHLRRKAEQQLFLKG